MPERSRGSGLHHRPPDVPRCAHARRLVLEDPRSSRARMRKACVCATLLTFDAVFPDTFRPVGPIGCPTGLPLLGLSKDRPSVVLPAPESTPGCPSRDRLRDGAANTRPRSVLVVSHHLDVFLLRYRARVLQRAPDPGVHPVSGPPLRVAPLRRPFLGMLSLPSEAFPPSEAARATLSPSRKREFKVMRPRNCVTSALPRCSPRSLPPRPLPPLPRHAATVARACMSRSVR